MNYMSAFCSITVTLYWILLDSGLMDIIVIILACQWRNVRYFLPGSRRKRSEAIADIKEFTKHNVSMSKIFMDETVLREMAIFSKGTFSRHLREGSVVFKDACLDLQHVKRPVLNLVIEPNTCCGILGLAAAGKSAVLKIIRGELKLDYGEVYVNGVLNCHPSKIGYFSKSIELPFVLQVIEVMLIHAELRKVPLNYRRGAVETLAAIFGVNEFLRRWVFIIYEPNLSLFLLHCINSTLIPTIF